MNGCFTKSFHEEWEYVHSTQEWGIYPTEHVIRFVARNYYKLDRGKTRILDFGCGEGAHAWYLAREGFDVYAFDGSKIAVRKETQRLEKEHLEAHFQVSDALDLGYPDNFFDAVIDNVCIYSNLLTNIQVMYQNVYKMLKSGGKFFTTCFGKKTDGYGSGEVLEKDTFVNMTEGALVGRGITHYFDKEALEKMLLDSGFQNVQIDYDLYTDRGITVELFIAYADKL